MLMTSSLSLSLTLLPFALGLFIHLKSTSGMAILKLAPERVKIGHTLVRLQKVVLKLLRLQKSIEFLNCAVQASISSHL